jgi:aspartyl-tRNA(Asn)/glutamyl-tRNA(Gln) amidotransferase subunit A
VKYGLKEKGEDLMETYFKTRGKGFGPEVRRRIFIGTYVLSSGYLDAYYNKANAVRDLIRKDFEKAYNEVDIILTPTTAGPAFKIGEKSDDPVKMYLEDIFTVPANHAGLPAISLPYGEAEGLPLGIQFIAPHQNENLLFEIGKELEQLK